MKTIIFDFDGVIADSNEAVMKSLEQIAFGKKVTPISKIEYSNLRTKDLFKRLKILWFQVPYYVMKARKLIESHKNLIKIHHEFLLLVKKINKMDLEMWILPGSAHLMIKI